MKKSLVKSIFFILLIFVWIYIFSSINVNEFVNIIGINNIYIFIFFLALFAGVSSLTSSSYIAAIVSLATVPEISVYVLAITAGISLTIGDGIFYYLGRKSRDHLPHALDKRLNKLSDWIHKKPKRYVQVFAYLYTGFTPLPADILSLSLSFAKYPFRDIVFPLFLGNTTLVFVIFYLARYGHSLYFGGF